MTYTIDDGIKDAIKIYEDNALKSSSHSFVCDVNGIKIAVQINMEKIK